MAEVHIHPSKTISQARGILRNSNGAVNLDDIVFVGDAPRANTIATLPGTYPDGDIVYFIYRVTQAEKLKGKTPTEISREQQLPLERVRDFYYGGSSHSVDCAESALEERVLPFSFHNPAIVSLNDLLSFAFWTGSISGALVQVTPNELNRPVLEKVLRSMAIKERRHDGNGRHRHHYSIHNGSYYISSVVLSRTFALLGLPFQQGDKTKIENFDIPWYAKFVAGGMLSNGNEFNTKSQQKSGNFLKRFCYVLLSDKSTNAHEEKGFAINLMSTYSKEVGVRLTKRVAGLLNRAFPDLEITKGDLMSSQRGDRESYTNRIYVYKNNINPILEQLMDASGMPSNIKEPIYIRVKRLSSHALL